TELAKLYDDHDNLDRSSIIFMNAGIANFRLGQHKEAIVQFSRSNEIRPDYPPNLSNWANSLRLNEQYKEADDIYERISDLTDDVKLLRNVYSNWTENLLNQKKYGLAVEKYEKFLDLSPDAADAYDKLYQLGQASFADKDDDAARSAFTV